MAGVALTASGLSIRDQVFDTAVATPGAVAIVGGALIMVVALALDGCNASSWRWCCGRPRSRRGPPKMPRRRV